MGDFNCNMGETYMEPASLQDARCMTAAGAAAHMCLGVSLRHASP
jgi:hypothetical protein